jgi:hypothetical protein
LVLCILFHLTFEKNACLHLEKSPTGDFSDQGSVFAFFKYGITSSKV